MKKILQAASCALIFSACTGSELAETRHQTGSQALTASSDYGALYVANAYERTVARVDLASATATEIDVGGEATKLARAGDHVFVTLKDQRQVAVYLDTGSTLELETTIDVGAEPYGIVASEDGTRIYVAVALAGKVLEIDADTHETLNSWNIANEPRWLALHPAGMLYVGTAWKGMLNWIDVASGEQHQAPLPGVTQFNPESGEDVTLDRRITGDPAVSPNGEYLVVPGMYLDTTTPVIEPEEGSDTGIDSRPPSSAGGYASQRGVQRFSPVVAIIQTSGDGTPMIDNAEIARVDAVGLDGNLISGYPATVAISPDSQLTFVGIEGSSAVAVIPTERSDSDFVGSVVGSIGDFDGDVLGRRSFTVRNLAGVTTNAGPRALAFTADQTAFVYNFLDRTVQSIDAAAVSESINKQNTEIDFERGGFRTNGVGVPFTRDRISVSSVRFEEDIEQGRRLFFSANDSRMSADAVGLSCATCHFDSRSDGLTWTFERGLRQTPSLAGQVSLTEPVRWEGERDTVADDARQTSQGLMGGSGISEAEILAVAKFIDFTPDVDAPLRGEDDEAVARGAEIFHRPEVACANCHSGDRYTDNAPYSMFGISNVVTRSLVGISGSPPYFHDGSAQTLRGVLERVKDGSMGDTSSLSDAEMDDLEAFLKSL